MGRANPINRAQRYSNRLASLAIPVWRQFQEMPCKSLFLFTFNPYPSATLPSLVLSFIIFNSKISKKTGYYEIINAGRCRPAEFKAKGGVKFLNVEKNVKKRILNNYEHV